MNLFKVFGIHKADPERLDPRTKSGTGIDPLSATGDVIMDTGEIGTSEEASRAAFSDRIKALNPADFDPGAYKAAVEQMTRENTEAEEQKQKSDKERERIAMGNRVGTSMPPEVVERQLIEAQKKARWEARTEARKLERERAEQEEREAHAFRTQIDLKRWAKEHQEEVERAAKWEEYKRLGPEAYKKKLEDDNKLDKMLRKTFGIRKDMPPEPLGEAFPQHELKTVECELGQCLSNSTRSARRNLNMNPHIIHGSHIDLEGPHSWVEFDHPEHGKIVFDPTSGLAGTPKDMYQDPAIEGKWGRNPNTPLPRLDAGWPTLIPEYRYALRDYHMKTGEREDNMGFIDHPDHKISEEDRLFPSRSFFENKNPGKERAMWDTLHQFGRKALPEGDHTGYAPIDKMLWKWNADDSRFKDPAEKHAFYQELLRRQNPELEHGPSEGYTTEWKLPDESWYPEYRKIKYPDPDDPDEYLQDEHGEDKFKLVPTFIQNASTVDKMLWKAFGVRAPTFDSAPDSQGNERAFEANNFGRYQSPRISRAIHRNDRGLDTDHLLLERTRTTDPDNRPAQYPHEWKLKALSEHYNNLLIANKGKLPLDLHRSIHAQATQASDPDMNIAWHSISDDTHPLESMDYTTFSKDHLRHATYPQDEGLLYPYGPNYKNPANPNPSSSVSQVGNRYLMENVAALRYPVEDIMQTPEWNRDFKNVIDNYKLSDTLFSQPPASPDLIEYKPPTKYGNIPSGPPIKATWGEPQDVHEMQREHRRKRNE